jgi:hypothetical protein
LKGGSFHEVFSRTGAPPGDVRGFYRLPTGYAVRILVVNGG